MHRTNQVNKNGGNLKGGNCFAMARGISSKWEIQQRFGELTVATAVPGLLGGVQTQR